MKIYNYKEPFYHSIIYDYYDENEQNLIWQEIDFLNQPGKLLTPDKTGDENASPNKVGIFLDDIYHHNEFRKLSNILTLNRKIFFILDLLKENIFSNYLSISNHDLTLLSYYGNNAYYNSHYDNFIVSSVNTFWRTPKEFQGGNLMFDHYNYTPNLDHNSMIIFPSFEWHSVSPVIMKPSSNNGRYSINQFFGFRSS